MAFEDKELNCADCKETFIWNAEEQAFYAEKGFENAPKRCKPCREAKKARRETGGGGNTG